MVVMTKKLKEFEVVFNDPAKSYSSGDKVAGKIVLEVQELTQVSAMRVIGIGCAKVEYPKGKQHCKEEVDYLRYEDTLRLDDHPTEEDGSVILRPGKRYEYMFGFELPQQGQLVSSYKGKFGSVQYYVKAFLDRPGQPAQETMKNFEVLEPIDVNTPELMSPAVGTKGKKVTCMFISDGQVSVNAKIDRRGYCEGEDICIDANFENTCSRIVVPKAAIVAKHIYQANGRSKVQRQKLCSVRGNHIISGTCEAWRGKTIRVPKIKPSILDCNIIRVEYALMVYVHIPGSDKLILELPVVIGTIPYNGFSSRNNSLCSQSSSTASNSWTSMPSSGTASNSWTSMPSAPPSYSDISNDYRMESPTLPLLDDYDGCDSPLFMMAPRFEFPPPAYKEVEEFNGNVS
ncbi:thioredoxin-interacting protein-like [Polypterus senegalus]|uniref:thioredoxin-interacting protein-like n=1 Tax=Polypterus senegalus TaxID=55291 RepID=UPI0019630071|nr:thioredoxin-interacting protein-like [Polypterus senegalus]